MKVKVKLKIKEANESKEIIKSIIPYKFKELQKRKKLKKLKNYLKLNI